MPHDGRSPHIFQDGPGNTASGEEVMDNFDAVWTSVDVLTQPGRAVDGGFFSQSASGSRSNTAYGQLDNGPDQVSGIVLPANGLLKVLATGIWQSSVAGAGRAAIFVGSDQLKIAAPGSSGAPIVAEITTPGTPAFDAFFHTSSSGLTPASGANAYTADVATGQVLGSSGDFGGPAYIFGLAAGTYTVSIQYKASSGSVSAKSRKLWVSAEAYA
jgi:hypothetical protein